MIYTVSKKNKSLKGTIYLTASKSESNRVLIIQAICKEKFTIKNLAQAEDTKILKLALGNTQLTQKKIDIGNAGTAMRFLTAYLATQEGEFILTGSPRMKERPIAILVDALKELGADIQYLDKVGFPPLKIIGTKVPSKKRGFRGVLTIDGSVSSQYITALLLIAPTLPDELKINLIGKISSRPYIEMTLKIMKYFGIKYSWGKNTITIKKQNYKAKDYTMEADWSAASYWYEIAALADDVDLKIIGLKKNSLQGDAVIADIMKNFGIKTKFIKNGIHLTKSEILNLTALRQVPKSQISYAFLDCPDLAQSVIVTAAALSINGKFSGLESLKIKETDRILALKTELKKFGTTVQIIKNGTVQLATKSKILNPKSQICTYDDHRMAMAFAPLAMKFGTVKIENPEVVSKSYPAFWSNMKKAGFIIEED